MNYAIDISSLLAITVSNSSSIAPPILFLFSYSASSACCFLCSMVNYELITASVKLSKKKAPIKIKGIK